MMFFGLLAILAILALWASSDDEPDYLPDSNGEVQRRFERHEHVLKTGHEKRE